MAPRDLTPGSEVGRYRIEGVLATRATGVVYSAMDPVLERRVALKLLEPAEVPGVGLDEARAMARIAGPNLVPIYDVGIHEHRPFFAMGLVDGVALPDWLAASRRNVHEIVGVFLQAGRGLAQMHAAGLFHGRFRMEDVWIDRAGVAKLADFGYARVCAASGDDAHVDRADLAACLFEALYGVPAEAEDATQPSGHRATWSFALRRVRPLLKKASSREGDRSHPSMLAFLSDLERTLTRGAERHIWSNVLVQAMLWLVHLWMTSLLLGPRAPSSPVTADEGMFILVYLWFIPGIIYIVFGVFWIPLTVVGLVRRKSWGRSLSLLYALLGLPSGIVTPYALYALWSLTRPRVKARFTG